MWSRGGKEQSTVRIQFCTTLSLGCPPPPDRVSCVEALDHSRKAVRMIFQKISPTISKAYAS
jgi:hypothetical protein